MSIKWQFWYDSKQNLNQKWLNCISLESRYIPWSMIEPTFHFIICSHNFWTKCIRDQKLWREKNLNIDSLLFFWKLIKASKYVIPRGNHKNIELEKIFTIFNQSGFVTPKYFFVRYFYILPSFKLVSINDKSKKKLKADIEMIHKSNPSLSIRGIIKFEQVDLNG